MGLPGGPELIIILVIILLLFGASRIPSLARSLGSGVREFKKGSSGDYDSVDEQNEKEDGELTAGAGEAGRDTHTAQMREEAERAEQRQGSGESR